MQGTEKVPRDYLHKWSKALKYGFTTCHYHIYIFLQYSCILKILKKQVLISGNTDLVIDYQHQKYKFGYSCTPQDMGDNAFPKTKKPHQPIGFYPSW